MKANQMRAGPQRLAQRLAQRMADDDELCVVVDENLADTGVFRGVGRKKRPVPTMDERKKRGAPITPSGMAQQACRRDAPTSQSAAHQTLDLA